MLIINELIFDYFYFHLGMKDKTHMHIVFYLEIKIAKMSASVHVEILIPNWPLTMHKLMQ